VEGNAKLTEQQGDSAHPIGGKGNLYTKDEYVEESRDSLVARLKAGNRAAATELVDLYYEQIYLFMRRLGHNFQVSEDLTQECFLQAWYHISGLRGGKTLNGWLYRIASNISKLYWRRSKGKDAVGIIETEVPDNSEAGIEKVRHHEELNQLKNAVEQLPMKLRQAVVLHYMQHLSISEAAQAAGTREGTLKSRLSRALKHLRKQIGPENREL